MNIHEIIRTKRRELGLTQEKVADMLGVSAAAVNKWERGVSRPDIALLPVIARLLHTDVNTLLSFEEELSRQEVAVFINKLAEVGTQQGAEHAYQAAAEMIRQYPGCHMLLLNAAMVLDGVFAMAGAGADTPDRSADIEAWYKRAAESEDLQIQNQANAQLVSRYIQRREYSKAQSLLDSLPPEPAFDRRHLQAMLYLRQERWEDAAKLTETGLLQDGARLHTALATLMEVARKEQRTDAAEQVAETGLQLARLLDQNEMFGQGLRFQQAVYQKDADAFLDAARQMLTVLLDPWPNKGSVLYRHLPDKELDPCFRKNMLAKLFEDMENPQTDEYGFVRARPEYKALLEEYKSMVQEV